MTGNEAIARGILEAGVKIASGYPGTPSTEILPAVAECIPFYPDLRVEWSVNEKVAFEVAYAASMVNARGVATMKHVGVNVASDSLMVAAYHGARGGMVLISADDPSQFSSQNEQDNRYYGLHALIPVVEPCNPQEAKDLIKLAFELSEENKSVVLYRTTTRLNHGRSEVILGDIQEINRDYAFDWDRQRWVCIPSNMRIQRTELLERMQKLREVAETFPFNSLIISQEQINGKRIGFVGSGVAFAHLKDTLHALDIENKVSLLKLGMVNPLPKRSMLKLMQTVDELLIVEELEPIFEEQFKAVAFDAGLTHLKIHGKDLFPQQGELLPEVLLEKISTFLGLAYSIPEGPTLSISAPPRLPQMCPACHHRNVYFVMKKLEKKLKKKFINNNDIGCYSLGVYPPLQAIDTALCMGGSIGMANGFSKLFDDVIITAFLGDSTFFHSGIAPLVNAVYNQNNMLVIISDNYYTSMTGGQDNPSDGIKITQEPGVQVKIEALVQGCGVPPDKIWVHDPYDLEAFTEKFEAAVLAQGVRVFIARHMCALQEMRVLEANKIKIPVVNVDSELCNGCQICVRQFGCPAFLFDFETRKASVDQFQCRGCKSCLAVCPQGAFYAE